MSTAAPFATVPPPAWHFDSPQMIATWRIDDHRVVAILDAPTAHVLDSVTVAWRDPDALLAEYKAAGVVSRTVGTTQTKATASFLTVVRLDRPDLVANQLGWHSPHAWHEWSDGSWRSPAFPLARSHLVTAAPRRSGDARIGTITVRLYPGSSVVAHARIDPLHPDDTDGLDAALNRLGYTVDHWTPLPGHVRYAAALPGLLAQRDWYTQAIVRIVRETTVAAVRPAVNRTFRVGQTVTMQQRGRAGREVLRDVWATSSDVNAAHIIPADSAEIVEVLDDYPATWDAAALSAEALTALLEPHHADAAKVVEAWADAGVHVARTHRGLVIRTPAPELLKVGELPHHPLVLDRFNQPYEVFAGEGHALRLDVLADLPLDPVAAAIRRIAADELGAPVDDLEIVRAALTGRPDGDSGPALSDAERWDVSAVRSRWRTVAQRSLSAGGITWDPDTGAVIVPADMATDRAAYFWDLTRQDLPRFIDSIHTQARNGRRFASADSARPCSAPGGRWVLPSGR